MRIAREIVAQFLARTMVPSGLLGAGTGLVGGNIEMARDQEGQTREMTRELRVGPSRPSLPVSVGVKQADPATPASYSCAKANLGC